MSIWRFADRISPVDPASRLTLGEGATPLLLSRHIGPEVGLERLYFKLETTNPTGSYKDRFSAAAVSGMLQRNVRRCLATSSGNTGAALAAYCAAAGIDCAIAVVETTPADKARQMLAYGARLFRVRGFGINPRVTADVLEHMVQLGRAEDAELQISAFAYSPEGMSGVQTLSYELAEQAVAESIQIDHVFAPAGGGGLTLAVARGFADLAESGIIARGPRIECVQPDGNDTIATALRTGAPRAVSVSCTSRISGLQVPNVIDGDAVVELCRASGGSGHTVEDSFVWHVQQLLARQEGIFCEPAGAVALAGVLRALAENRISADATVVCLITGSAFKDTASLAQMTCDRPVMDVEPTMLAEAIKT